MGYYDSAAFQLYHEGNFFIGGGHRSTWGKSLWIFYMSPKAGSKKRGHILFSVKHAVCRCVH